MTATTVDSTTPTPAEQPQPIEARSLHRSPPLPASRRPRPRSASRSSSPACSARSRSSRPSAASSSPTSRPARRTSSSRSSARTTSSRSELLIVAVALVVGAGLGLLARRWFTLAAAGIAAFAGFGFVAALGDPSVSGAPQASSPRPVPWPASGRCRGSSAGPDGRARLRARERPRSACRTGRGAVS